MRSDVVLIDFKEGRGAALVKHISDDGGEFVPFVENGGWFIDYTNLLFPGNEKDGGDLFGGKASEFVFRPEDPLGIDRGGGL